MKGECFMKCEWCGREVNDGEKFCPSCKSVINKPNNRKLAEEAEEQTPESKSAVSVVLKVIGSIAIFLGLLSLFISKEGVAAITVIVSGLLLFGFSEVITVLLSIKDKLSLLCNLIKFK